MTSPNLARCLAGVAAGLSLSLIAACSTGRGMQPAPTPSPSAYLDGNLSKVPLDGDPRRPSSWTLLKEPSVEQAAVERSLQQFDSIASTVDLSGPSDAYSPLLWSITAQQVQPAELVYGSTSDDRLPGVVWVKVLDVHIESTSRASTTLCRDKRDTSSPLSVKDVKKLDTHVNVYYLGWTKVTTTTPTWGEALRWRGPEPRLTSSRAALQRVCDTWAAKHRVWTGPDAG